MKKTAVVILAMTPLAACATNPGNIGADHYETILAQRATMEAPIASDRTCEEVDAEVRLAYLDMQPEQAGLARRAFTTGKNVGESVALRGVAAHVPGVGLVNSMVKGRSGKKKADAMLGHQLGQSNKLHTLSAERNALGCEGSMLALFEDK